MKINLSQYAGFCPGVRNADKIVRNAIASGKARIYTLGHLIHNRLYNEELAEKGVHNINFVTPTHYTDKIAKILKKIKPSLKIPIVWNCGGYEKEETLDLLDGLVDIYLPDFKYFDSELAFSYSAAPDYRDVAVRALKKMFSQVVPMVVFSST